MAIATTNTKVHLSSLVSLRLVNIFENALSAYTEWNDARQTFKALSKLSERELEDIGLNRGDVYTLAGK